MYIKKRIFLSIILFFLFSGNIHAKFLIRMPTQEQIDKLCIPIRLTTDGEIHYFYYKHVKKINEVGAYIMFGRDLENINFLPYETILNYSEALEKYKRLTKEKP